MTHAIRVHGPGGPEVLAYEEQALAPPPAGEARVRHTAIGLNYVDVYFRSGLYPPPAYPFTPGFEAAGVVEAIGAGVTEVAVGDRVACGTGALGAYSQARNVSAQVLVRLPAAVDERSAAALMLKGMTAHMLLRRTFQVERGHTILVHAAAGGVGSLVCQWARHLGATVIGTVGNDEKAERARADGCDHPIVYAREDFVARVRELTAGRGVEVVYDSVGKDTLQRSLECLAPLGMLVSFGQSSGAIDAFPMASLAKKSLFLTRPSLLLYNAQRADLLAGAGEMLALVERGVLRAHIDQTFPLAQAEHAHRALEARATTGSSLLIP